MQGAHNAPQQQRDEKSTNIFRIVLRKYREEKQDGFNQQLFKVRMD
jgi:hypothetical protein